MHIEKEKEEEGIPLLPQGEVKKTVMKVTWKLEV